MDKKINDFDFEKKLQRGRAVLNYLNACVNRNLLDKGYEWLNKNFSLELNEIYLFQILEVTFEEKAPRKEAIENILGTLRGMVGISFLYLILGDESGVKFYFGAVRDKCYPENDMPFSVHDLEQDILTPSMKGNFRGSKILEIPPDERKNILDKLKNAPSFGMLEGVPSVDEKNENFQGTDRLIDVMQGDEFGFAVIAKPYTDIETDELEQKLFMLSEALLPVARHTIQRSTSTGKNRNEGKNFSYAKQAGDSTQYSESESYSTSDTTNHDERRDDSNQIQATSSKSTNEQYSTSKNYNKRNGDTESADSSSGSNNSVQSQTGVTYSVSATQGTTTANSFTENHSYRNDTTENHSRNFSKNLTRANNETLSKNFSLNEQMESESKSAVEWLNYIDKILMPRVDRGRGKGIFLCCTYLFATKRTSLYRLANTAISLYSGTTGNKSALTFYDLTEKITDNDCINALKNLQIPIALRDESFEKFPSAGLSRHEREKFSYCGSWLSANELGLLAGLPQKEVIGLQLREEVEFGVNINKIPAEHELEIGCLVRSGEVKKNISVSLDKRDLDKHAFISGVTGSGKTTTCKNILIGWGQAFLVIEPAKTEYRALKENCPDILFFTPGLHEVAPFFLNPFELFPGEKISSRADMLKATFEASFTMEAAIPQILEAAIYRAYEDKGWHISSNTWRGGNPFADGVYAFPTLSDFVKATQEITKKQGFDERLKNDYLGSINARLEGLMVGAKGQMFNTARSINFLDIVKRRVVIELEEIRSSSEKSLIMGFIMTNLLQAVKHCHALDKNFRHITLIEEAHRLLSRYVPGDNLNKKQGIEVFTDMLAEVRKYGESLIIVDQIPDKMTPEILKNTNTKIIHKLFAQDDKEAVGNTMALTDEQKSFLSNLPTGRAIMFSQGWTKAIQLQINENFSSELQEIDVEELRQTALKYYSEPENLRRGILCGIEKLSNVDEKSLADYLKLMQNGDTFLKIYIGYLRGENSAYYEKKLDNFAEELKKAVKNFGEDMVFAYLYGNAYSETIRDREETLRMVIKEIVSEGKDAKQIIDRYIDFLS